MSEITGVKEVVAALGRLESSTRRKALRGALRKAAGVIKKQAESNVASVVSSKATGLLQRSIVIRGAKAARGSIRLAISIAGKKLSARGARVGLYGSVLEFGKEGQPPRPWLRPAIQSKSQEAISQMGAEFARNLDAAVKDAAK